MDIAVLGTGNIGGTLGRAWARAGHRVVFGTRDAAGDRARALAAEGVAVDSVAAAVAHGAVVLFAVPGPAMQAVIDAHAPALAGRIVIDATNKIRAQEMSSVGALAARVPTAHVFRAFNTLGWENFAQPRLGGERADLFYCGPDEAAARAAVEALIADVGLRPVRVGGLDQVDVLDGVLRLWFALAMGQGMGRRLAFRVLTPDADGGSAPAEG